MDDLFVICDYFGHLKIKGQFRFQIKKKKNLRQENLFFLARLLGNLITPKQVMWLFKADNLIFSH